jgi:DNA-binding transcriptional ArsR family regulator
VPRRLFTFFSAVSLLLCVAVCVLCGEPMGRPAHRGSKVIRWVMITSCTPLESEGIDATIPWRMSITQLDMPHRTFSEQSTFPAPPETEVITLARWFTALSEPTRLRCLMVIASGERAVRDISDTLGIPQPTVSHHLAHLKREGIVFARRNGNRIIYSLNDPTGKVRAALSWAEPSAAAVISQAA